MGRHQDQLAVAKALTLAGEKGIDAVMAALRDASIQWLDALDSTRAHGC